MSDTVFQSRANPRGESDQFIVELPFAEVESGIFLVVDALELDKRGVLVLVSETSSVTGEDSLSVKTAHGDELRFWSDFLKK